MTDSVPSLSIVADIGGTNTRVALADGAQVKPGSIRYFRNRDHPGLEAILAGYRAEAGVVPRACCVAVAGPVRQGCAEMTNIDWAMNEEAIAVAVGVSQVILLNDLQAQGHALGHIAPGALHTVVEGPTEANAPMLVVGLGTGVNAAPVHGRGAGRVVPPSECGHIGLPVRDARDLALLRHIEAIPDDQGILRRHASIEEVLSGRGLGYLHGFALAEASEGSDLTGALRSDAVLRGAQAGDPFCQDAVRDYIRFLGRFLGDLALIHLPYGGIYLIGGMARALLPFYERFDLSAEFRAPRWIDLLDNAFRVMLIEDDAAALTGCAAWLAALDN